ncbi:MAG TPA: hypothetical protein VFP05_08270 [Thermomicrobiales bacterium]|nr:hypothetical protein [Thermomicrobiales bacterium]
MNREPSAVACDSNADCPLGSTCARFESGIPGRRYLCDYPCCTDADA